MYFRQVLYFATVARSGSFSAASRVLNVSQPALGQQVRALEDALGVTLLHRHSRGARLSDAGAVFLVHAEALLAGAADAAAAMAPFRTPPHRTVTIGVTPTPGLFLVPRLVEQAAPGVTIQVRPGLSSDLLRQVGAAEIDLALCYVTDAPGQVRIRPLYEEDLFLVGAPDVVGGGGDIPFKALPDFSLVLDNRLQDSRQLVDRLARDLGVSLRVANEIEPSNLKREMMLRHGRCSILPFGLFRDEILDGRLTARRIVRPTATRALCLVEPEGGMDEATAAILDCLRAIVGDLIEAGGLGWRSVAVEAG